MEYLEIVQKAKNGSLSVMDFADFVLANDTRLKRVERSQAAIATDVSEIKDEYTILPGEADDIQKEIKSKGISVLGGKKSRAYNNRSLRDKVYKDIHWEVKRQYGLITDTGRQMSYKKLKRKYVKGAIALIKDYEPPIAIANAIDIENDLGDLE